MDGGIDVYEVVITSFKVVQQVAIGDAQGDLITEFALRLVDEEAKGIFDGEQEKKDADGPDGGRICQPGRQEGDPGYDGRAGIRLYDKDQACQKPNVQDADDQVQQDQHQSLFPFRMVQDQECISYDLFQEV